MEIPFIEVTFIFLVSVASLYYYFHDKNGLPTNWPIVGMLPALFKNIHRIHDFTVEALAKSQLTFLFKGPWFTNVHILVTLDPANVHHVMSKNFGNYPKGTKLIEVFDALGDGAFISSDDTTVWQYHHKLAHSFFGHPNFHQLLMKIIGDKLESGLIPVLDHVCNQGIEIDLQDLFSRLTFDTTCTILTSHDPKSLSIELPRVPQAQAMDDIEEAIAYRYVLPTSIWKFLRWLNVGIQKKHKEASKILDEFGHKSIATKREEMSKGSRMAVVAEPGLQRGSEVTTFDQVGFDLLTLYMSENDAKNAAMSNDSFFRDTFLNYFVAGRDTTSTALSWLFYLLSKNQRVVSKIRQELIETTNIMAKDTKEYYSKLVYLHAALCEALRLYPPGPFEAKAAIEADILPSGHKVEPHMQIVFSIYAMGRMKTIWGDDCCEFKPERWICKQGKLKHEPSYKFLAFNTGPRACLGKDVAFIQMKAVTASILRNYDIKAVEGHPVVPEFSFLLRMKHGFKVKVVHFP